ncbi:MAG: hypothetical protein IIZ29_02185 [Schwartzia sp.]|nr:hypothetical protein [Schwartzia sp. (in: firmicutes)]
MSKEKEAKKEKKEKKSVWLSYSDKEKKELEKLSSGYIDFLSNCKTERESVAETIRLAVQKEAEELYSIVEGSL